MAREVRAIVAGDVDALDRFFALIATDETVLAYFRPFPFDRANAERIAFRQGIVKDEYYAVFEDGEIIAFGMLRGWDEGYPTPAFGVCVRGDQRGSGLGRVIMDHGIRVARARGAHEMMLKVFEQNVAARRLYESFGFTFDETTPDGAQLVGRLQLSGDES